MCFGEIVLGSGRLFVDLPDLSWDPRPGLMGHRGWGRPGNVGLVLWLNEKLMYPLSSTAKRFIITLSVLLLPLLEPIPIHLKMGMILLVHLWYLA